MEQLLIGLILDGKIAGRIDQLKHVLELDKEADQAETYAALRKWADQVNSVTTAVVSRLSV